MIRWNIFLECKAPQRGSSLYAWTDAEDYKAAWKAALIACKGVHTSCIRVERA